MTAFPLPRRDGQLAALGVTALIHALLVLGWQAVRQLPLPQGETSWLAVRWIAPAARTPAKPAVQQVPRRPLPAAQPAQPPVRSGPRAVPRGVPAAAPAIPAATLETAPAPDTSVEPTAADTPDMSAKAIIERARRDAGAVDRALRKESRPLIVAPRDSPQIRLRKGIEAAAEMAPNAWYQTPKMAELVNSTGDGARRTRVITGNGTYCVTERSTHTSVDMIEKHGKLRITNCPEGEAPANPQEWRTARDP